MEHVILSAQTETSDRWIETPRLVRTLGIDPHVSVNCPNSLPFIYLGLSALFAETLPDTFLWSTGKGRPLRILCSINVLGACQTPQNPQAIHAILSTPPIQSSKLHRVELQTLEPSFLSVFVRPNGNPDPPSTATDPALPVQDWKDSGSGLLLSREGMRPHRHRALLCRQGDQ
jgi:hypothetical protein